MTIINSAGLSLQFLFLILSLEIKSYFFQTSKIMKLIVGLGNPGEKYKKTRHNLGFRAVEKLFTSYSYPDFKFNKKFNSLISQKKINNEKVILVMPQTFMNESGRAVKTLLNYFNKSIISDSKKLRTVLWVIHDDLALPLGKIRISQKGSSGGHKGIQSIIDALKNENFVRFRIGIKPLKLKFILTKSAPVSLTSINLKKRMVPFQFEIKNFVLQKFTPQEEKIIQVSLQEVSQAIELSLWGGLEKAMNRFN